MNSFLLIVEIWLSHLEFMWCINAQLSVNDEVVDSHSHNTLIYSTSLQISWTIIFLKTQFFPDLLTLKTVEVCSLYPH